MILTQNSALYLVNQKIRGDLIVVCISSNRIWNVDKGSNSSKQVHIRDTILRPVTHQVERHLNKGYIFEFYKSGNVYSILMKGDKLDNGVIAMGQDLEELLTQLNMYAT